MSDVVWKTAHSVDSHASLPFAWAYMTTVANWDDPPATFELDGPFVAGSLESHGPPDKSHGAGG